MSAFTTHDASDTDKAQFLAPETHQRADGEGEGEREDEANYSGFSATYSPDDNKLRLYSLSRLDSATYARVKGAGFIWAPKQELFVAPAWTPGREDLLNELCGEIGDEDTSLVDRAEVRADRFEDYHESRAQEAGAARRAVDAVAQRFEFGQPILVGHHSERKARKDAERIQNGMRKALKMWDTAQYWKQRAAGALRHAQYKERADVRHRRIKTITADKRKQEKIIAEASAYLKAWQREGLTREQAMHIANGSYYSRCFTLAEFPRQAPASQYEGPMGLWSALDGNVITAEQAREICLKTYPATIAHAQRWVAHYENRIAYETAMLAEQGGTAADRFEVVKGGRVLVGGAWLVVLRVNKAVGKINSVSTNRRYVPVVGIEEVKDYQAPDAEQAATVAAATKVAPLRNYPGEGFACITQAQWDAIPKDYRGTKTIAATATTARHRVRVAMGVYVLAGEKDWNKRHSYPFVFITDGKLSRPDAVTAADQPVATAVIPGPEIVEPRAVYQAPAPTEFDALRQQLSAGINIKVVVAPQLFQTPPAEAAQMVDEVADLLQPGARVLEPNGGTGRLLRPLKAYEPLLDLVAVEINRDLSEQLRASSLASQVHCGDFLQCTAEQLGGLFDVVVMNPPFIDGADIKHILHAFKMLKPAGRLVAICANGPRQNQILRALVDKQGGEWVDLPADTFKEEGTSVRTARLTLRAE